VRVDREARRGHDQKQTPLFFFAGKMSRVHVEVDVNGEELFVVDDKVLLLLSCLFILAFIQNLLALLLASLPPWTTAAGI
jgi:hypothetical protein